MLDIEKYCRKIRISILDQIYRTKESHIGSCFSVVEILAVLYSKILNIDPSNLSDPNRDRFLLSKGHAAMALYAALGEMSFFDKKLLDSFCGEDTIFQGHVSHLVPGIEFSTGALGHALSVGCGLSLSSKDSMSTFHSYVLLSDGELQEGSNWEAIMFAGAKKLTNLTAIVDYNKIQSLGRVDDICSLGSLLEKFTAFGWDSFEVDGHNTTEIEKVFLKPQPNKPKVIIAHTTKGKGVSFMEDSLKWHYRNPSKEEYETAKQEIQNNYATVFYR